MDIACIMVKKDDKGNVFVHHSFIHVHLIYFSITVDIQIMFVSGVPHTD